jgi:deoxyribonuclease-4
MGVCYDTSHGFAAGYDMRDEPAYNLTMSKFDKTIGIGRIMFFHLNDSARDLGSRVDRHAHIGKGKIGLNGFRLLLNDPRFRDLPMVLETPKGKDLREDKINMEVLRSIMRS